MSSVFPAFIAETSKKSGDVEERRHQVSTLWIADVLHSPTDKTGPGIEITKQKNKKTSCFFMVYSKMWTVIINTNMYSTKYL